MGLGFKKSYLERKSPQLITADGKRVITFATPISLYLLREYDGTQDRFCPPENDLVREEQLIGIGVCDLPYKIGGKFTLDAIMTLTPFFARSLLKLAVSKLGTRSLNPDVDAIMDVLEAELGGDDRQ